MPHLKKSTWWQRHATPWGRRLFLDSVTLEIQLSKRWREWDPTNQFNPAPIMFLSQARTRNSNAICRGLRFCVQWFEKRGLAIPCNNLFWQVNNVYLTMLELLYILRTILSYIIVTVLHKVYFIEQTVMRIQLKRKMNMT